MHIVLTNDDGVDAKGLICLYRELSRIATVTIIAPMLEHSGGSHAITLQRPLRADRYKPLPDIEAWRVDGTPVDCVKLGLTHLLESKPDLIVSGINAGANVGENLFYSGTVAAAIEAHIQNISGVAFSLDLFSGKDFEGAATWAAQFIKSQFIDSTPADLRLLNINIPGNVSGIKGIRITEQTRSGFKEDYVKRQDPKGRDYYWVKGHMYIDGDEENSDAAALRANYITITPLHIDFTNRAVLADMKPLEQDQSLCPNQAGADDAK